MGAAHPVTRGYRLKLHLIHGTVALLATAGGAIMGFMVTLALVVIEAQAGSFIFGLDDLLAFRWDILPIPLGALAGLVLARRRPHSVAWATAIGFGGLVAGTFFGWMIGDAMAETDVGHWAGGVIGAATGLVLGVVLSLRIKRIPRHPLITATAATLVFIGIFLFAVFGATSIMDLDPVEFPETLAGTVAIPEPARVDAIVFFVGDAGAAEWGKSPLLASLQHQVEQWSAALHRDSAVTIAFVGDNVYPQGVHNHDDPRFAADSAQLWSQVMLLGGAEAKRNSSIGLFVSGNHDWGNTTGDEGFLRVRNQDVLLSVARKAGYRVALLPSAGDPGPDYRDLRRNVRIAFFDTHWFLQERSPELRFQFFSRLRQTLDGARDREVILVAHHPYHSAGPHGAIIPGYHTLGVASVLKEAGALVQDLNSPPYDELLAGLRRTFASSGKPPLIYAGGHDHSLQVLSSAGELDPRFVLVSGAGSKSSSIRMEPGLVWGADEPGYMMLVFRKDDAVDLFVMGGNPDLRSCAGSDAEVSRCMAEGTAGFKVVYSASLLGPSKQPRELSPVVPDTTSPDTPWWVDAPPAAGTPVSSDSFTTIPGRTYPAGRLRRFFAGSLNRKLWEIPVRLPVLDLSSEAGGLQPVKVTGGKQTIGLRLLGRDGVSYDFRPIVKNPEAVLPRWMRDGAISDALEDQMAAQLPFGATVVAELQEALGIAAPVPKAVVMPNDPRLAQYRAMFAGRVGLFAVHPDERPGNQPGFNGYQEVVGSDEMYADLTRNPESTLDDRHFLRIRLLDLLVGDWDRHSGQWRWGRAGRQWKPIPEDRDWAFAETDGVVSALTRWFYPPFVGFSRKFPAIDRLVSQADHVDHRVLNRLRRDDFLAVAREVQAVLTDSVIAAAVAVLPPEYQPLERDRLVTALEARRDQLVDYAGSYYDHLARKLRVYGFAAAGDVVAFDQVSDSGARVRLRSGGPAGPVRLERYISARETKQVWLYIDEPVDTIVGRKGLPFSIELKKEDVLPEK